MEKYLKDNLSFLSTIDFKTLNENIYYQLNTLNAKHYNITQQEIYDQINSLYEKMRILEDVNAYLHERTQNKIAESSALCESLLKEIEESRDAIKETTYHNIYVDIQPTGSTTDRDGVQIPAAVIYNNEVVTKFNIKRSIPYVTEVKTYKKAYNNNINALEKGSVYRSYYITDQSYANGITEKMSFTFSDVTPVNKIMVKASGAETSNFQLHNSKDTINIKDLSWKQAIQSEKASFDINTKIYKEKVFLCDASRMAPNALTLLEGEIYKEIIGEKTMSRSELDTLLGLSALKADYQKYLAAVEDWKRRRAAVASQNQANGHIDSVPNHTIDKLPSELGANEITPNGIINPTINTENIISPIPVIRENKYSWRIPYNEEEKPSKENDDENIKAYYTDNGVIYSYKNVDKVFPSYESYRLDINDPNSDRYYKKLNNEGAVEQNEQNRFTKFFTEQITDDRQK